MGNKFHRFLELPWELRENIWRLAIRPACPGVHVFSIYNGEVGKDGSLDEMDDIVTTSRTYPGMRLAAPRWGHRAIGHHFHSQEHTASWTSNNPSTYLIDAGLWTACKESRFVIERELQSQSWYSDFGSSCDELHLRLEGENLAREMACFKEKDPTKSRYFTVFPNQDLFYLQPYNLETLNWTETRTYSSDLEWPGFKTMSHIALDFDVTWALKLKESGGGYWTQWAEMINTIAHLAIDAGTDGNVEFLWFIDYGIKRISKDPDQSQGQVVFFQGDRRFVEVSSGAREWGSWDDERLEVEDYYISCRNFVADVKHEIYDLTHDGFYNYPTGDTPARVGVLACERY